MPDRAARSHSERAAPSASVGNRFRLLRLLGINRIAAPGTVAGRGSAGPDGRRPGAPPALTSNALPWRCMNSSGDMTIWVVPSLNGSSVAITLGGAVTLEPFVGDRRAGDIAAQVLQFLALNGAPAHRRMETEAVEFGA